VLVDVLDVMPASTSSGGAEVSDDTDTAGESETVLIESLVVTELDSAFVVDEAELGLEEEVLRDEVLRDDERLLEDVVVVVEPTLEDTEALTGGGPPLFTVVLDGEVVVPLGASCCLVRLRVSTSACHVRQTGVV